METMRVLGDEICYRAKDCFLYEMVRSDFIFIQDPCEYWKLDDTIIKTIETAPDEELRESRDLILHIRRRNLY
ncbi:hypothetical protein GOBAR_DD05331 [Gossypium barbadense]|nr:hypothetical protein GOBAR_DD05331 [Gossypium barbadense]